MKHILIIEDEPTVRELLVRKAKEISNQVVIHSTGSAREALSISKKERIEAFFVDIQLEDYSGYDLVEQLRQLKKNINSHQWSLYLVLLVWRWKPIDVYIVIIS